MALRSPEGLPTSEAATAEKPGRWPEITTEEGDEVKDDEVECEVVERVDSSLGEDGSSEPEMLFTMLRGMWTKPSMKQTEKRQKIAKSTTTVKNCSQRRKTPRKNEENGRQNPARREN